MPRAITIAGLARVPARRIRAGRIPAHERLAWRALLVSLAMLGWLAAAPARAQQWSPSKRADLSSTDFANAATLTAFYASPNHEEGGASWAVLRTAILTQYYNANPDATTGDGLFAMRKFEAAVRKHENFLDQYPDGANVPVTKLFAIAAAAVKELVDPADKAIVAAAGEAVKQFSADIESLNADPIARQAWADAQNPGAYPLAVAERIVSSARELGAENPSFANAFDRSIGKPMGIGIRDSGAELVEKVPVLKAQLGIDRLLDGQGAIHAKLGRLETLAKREFASLHKEMSGIDERLNGLEKGQKELLEYVRDEKKRREEAEAQAKLAAEAQQRIDAANAAIYILSTIVGAADPKAGRQLQAVGTATVQIVTSLNQWTKAIAGLGAAEALSSLSTVILTGNVLGAVMAVLPAFVDTGPSPDEMILREIGALREQVTTLRTEMHDRFDRVDRSLNAIYSRLASGLREINLATGRIESGVTAMHVDLIGMRQDLHDFEARLYRVILDGANRSLTLEAANALNLRIQTTGTSTMPFDGPAGFLAHANFFATWGTAFAFDAVAAGDPPEARSYQDDDVLAELRRREPLYANIGYLSELVRRWGVDGFASGRSNAQQWALAATAYAQLLSEWPGHARRVAPGQAEALAVAGQQLKTSLKRIADRNAGIPAAPIAPNYVLYGKAIENYKTKLKAWLDQLTALEVQWQLDDRGGRQIDPFGTSEQPVDFALLQPAGDSGLPRWPSDTMTCAGQTVSMLAEPAIRSLLASGLVAKRLGIGDVAVRCNNARWSDLQVRELPKVTTTTGRLTLDITAQFKAAGDDAWRAFRVLTYTGERRTVCTEAPARPRHCEAIGPIVNASWDSIRAALEADVADAKPTSALDDLVTRVEAELKRLRRALYAHLRDASAAGPLHDAAQRLGGAQAALADLVKLGLPRAVDNDELLSSLIAGDQRVLDQTLGADLYADLVDEVEHGPWAYAHDDLAGKRSNPRLFLADVAQDRLTALAKRIDLHLGALGTRPQSHDLLDSALDRLAEAELIVSLAPTPPESINRPAIRGALRRGAILSARPGVWKGDHPLKYAYRWERCDRRGHRCKPIRGETNTTHKVSALDVGSRLRVRTSASGAGGSRVAYSAATRPVSARR